MLQTNLSTRPFYNERLVYLVLAIVAAGVAVLTVFNGRRLVELSRRSTELGRRVAADQSAADGFLRRAEQIRQGIDTVQLESTAAAAREANDLIDRRMFSWTEFLNLIEATLPPDVMLTAVRPQIHEGVVTVSMSVVGRSTEVLDTFMEQLEKTGAFADLLPRQEEVSDQGLHRALISGRYLGARKTATDTAGKSGGGARSAP